MEIEKSHVQADLRGLLEGDVLFNPIYQQLYASDASIHEIQPWGVVRPRSVGDVSELLKYCHEREIRYFLARGSGLAGQSLGRGIVVDFSRYLRVLQRPRNQLVRVQSGVVQAELNRDLSRDKLLFGPDPATRSVSTIGSMIAVDAAGSHFPRYGSAGDSLHSLQVVLSDGEVVELSRHDWTLENASQSRVGSLAQQVGLLLQQQAALIMRPPWSEVARGCGYRIEKVLDGERVDLSRLIAGSEGTLGIITEATLRLQPVPAIRGLMLLFFHRLDSAAKVAVALQQEQLSACDLMDRRLLEIARETEPVYASIIPRGAEAMLLVEMQGEDPAWVRSCLMRMLQTLQQDGVAVASFRVTTDILERNLLWRLARRVIPRLYRLKGSLRPLPFIEDISIPPRLLPEFLTEVQNILKAQRVTATLFAHALHGHVDVRPFLDLGNGQQQLMLDRLGELLYAKVFEFGGVICGQHALGLSRAAWAEKQLGPRLDLCRRIKQVFDPQGILNPGKFLSPTPPRVNEHLRPVPVYQSTLASWRSAADMPGDVLRADRHGAAPALEVLPMEVVHGAEAARLPWEETAVEEPSPRVTERVALPVLLNWSDQQSIAYSPAVATGAAAAGRRQPRNGCVPCFVCFEAKSPRPR